MKKFAWIFILMLLAISLFSQTKNTPEQYVDMYYQIAVRKMAEYKIPASITLAQGILESGSGNSNLARNANNHFGIKCHTEWTGDTYIMDDDEKNECFRKYKKAEESFNDHSLFLTTRPRYKFLFDELEVTDFRGWAHGLKKAGYATNPNYANLLISLIERYDLAKYDKMSATPAEPDKPIEQPVIADAEFTLPKGAYYTDRVKGIYIYNRIRTVNSAGRQPIDIAVEFDVPLKKLMKYNDLTDGDVLAGRQNVFLQPKRKKGTENNHIVQERETLWEISQQYGIKLSSIYKFNMLEPGEEVKPGETINLRKKRESRPQTIRIEDAKPTPRQTDPVDVKVYNDAVINIEMPPPPVQNEPAKESIVIDEPKKPEVEKPSTHVVGPGETLYFISNKYYITVEKLMEINNLRNYNISVGQTLKVSEDK